MNIPKYFLRLLMASLFTLFCLVTSCRESLSEPSQNKLTPAQSAKASLQIKVQVEIIGQSRLSTQIKLALQQQSDVFKTCSATTGIGAAQLTGRFKVFKSGKVSQFKIIEMPVGKGAFEECFSSHFSKLNLAHVTSNSPAFAKVGFYNAKLTWSLFHSPYTNSNPPADSSFDDKKGRDGQSEKQLRRFEGNKPGGAHSK